jgi:hypothetical protein
MGAGTTRIVSNEAIEQFMGRGQPLQVKTLLQPWLTNSYSQQITIYNCTKLYNPTAYKLR